MHQFDPDFLVGVPQSLPKGRVTNPDSGLTGFFRPLRPISGKNGSSSHVSSSNLHENKVRTHV